MESSILKLPLKVPSKSLLCILEARDRREVLRKRILKQYGMPLIQVSPVNPGPVKDTHRARRIQQEAEKQVSRILQNARIPILYETKVQEEAGPWALFVAEGPVRQIKMMLVELEETHPWGRLFDLDVIDPSGVPLSRRMLGYPERRCLVCGEPVSFCAPGSVHSLNVIHQAIDHLLETPRAPLEGVIYSFAEILAELCREALQEELSLTPKPGLVDRKGSGAHKDMNFDTFQRSIKVLIPYFKAMVLKGYETRHQSFQNAFEAVRMIGIEAEGVMYAATRGVNTHKGALFSLGLICGSAGRTIGKAQGKSRPFRAGILCFTAAQMVKGISKRELIHPSFPTKGSEAYRKYRIKGARGEAEQGFPHIRLLALPLFKILKRMFPNRREECLLTVLGALMGTVTDTNVLGRGGLRCLRFVQRQAFSFLLRGGAFTNKGKYRLTNMAESFRKKGLSPGGSADLLALTIFLDSVSQL